MTCRGNEGFNPYPLPYASEAVPLSRKATSSRIVGPGGSFALDISSNFPLTAAHIAGLSSGVSAIYLKGEITYKDAFGRNRYTKYLLFASGPMPRNVLSTYHEGNEAN